MVKPSRSQMWLLLLFLLFVLGCGFEIAASDVETIQPTTTEPLCPPGEPLCMNIDVEERDVCEIPLIIKPVEGAPFVSTRVFFIRDYTPYNTTESFAFQVLEMMDDWSGTINEPSRSSYDRFLASKGARVWTTISSDFVVTALNVPSRRLESVWNTFTDKVLLSDLSEYDFEHAVRTVEHDIVSIRDDPRVAASVIGYQLYTGKTLDIDSAIDAYVENLNELDFRSVEGIWDELHARRRMVVVVSGDIEPDEIERLVSDSFCSMQKGVNPPSELMDEPAVKDPAVSSEIYPDAPTYSVRGYFSAPDPSHKDYPAFSVAVSILNNKAYDLVRFQAGLAYSTGAEAYFLKKNYASIWFYSDEPLIAIDLMRQAIDEMCSGTVSEYELTSAYNTSVTDTYSSSQASSGQTWRLGVWEIVGGNRLLADELIQKMGEVSTDDVTEVSKTWFHSFSFGVTGQEDISQAINDAFKIDE